MDSKHTNRQLSINYTASAFAAMLAIALTGCAVTDVKEADIRVLENPRVGVQKLPSDKFGAVLVKEEWQFVLCQECKATMPSGKLVWLMVSTDKKWEPIEAEGEESKEAEAEAGVLGKAVKRFAFDSAKVSGDVSELASVLNKLKSTPAARIRITGFTDSVGDAKYNLALSKKRAQAVANWFVKNGVSRARMVVDGRGEQSPVLENVTAEGRDANRRSETVVSVEVLGS